MVDEKIIALVKNVSAANENFLAAKEALKYHQKSKKHYEKQLQEGEYDSSAMKTKIEFVDSEIKKWEAEVKSQQKKLFDLKEQLN